MPVEHMVRGIAAAPALVDVLPDAPLLDSAAEEQVREEVVQAVAGERSRVPMAQIFQDYEVRCRMRGMSEREPLDRFHRRLAMASAGLDAQVDWDGLWALASALPEEMWAPFLGIGRAARANEACPDDLLLAELGDQRRRVRIPGGDLPQHLCKVGHRRSAALVVAGERDRAELGQSARHVAPLDPNERGSCGSRPLATVNALIEARQLRRRIRFLPCASATAKRYGICPPSERG